MSLYIRLKGNPVEGYKYHSLTEFRCEPTADKYADLVLEVHMTENCHPVPSDLGSVYVAIVGNYLTGIKAFGPYESTTDIASDHDGTYWEAIRIGMSKGPLRTFSVVKETIERHQYRVEAHTSIDAQLMVKTGGIHGESQGAESHIIEVIAVE